MRMTARARESVLRRYPGADLQRVGGAWFLFRKFGRGNTEGFLPGWRVDLIHDVVDRHVQLQCVAEGLRTLEMALDATRQPTGGAR